MLYEVYLVSVGLSDRLASVLARLASFETGLFSTFLVFFDLQARFTAFI